VLTDNKRHARESRARKHETGCGRRAVAGRSGQDAVDGDALGQLVFAVEAGAQAADRDQPLVADDGQFHRLLAAFHLHHGLHEQTRDGVGGGAHPDRIESGGDAGERERRHQRDEQHHEHHLDESDAAAGAEVHCDFQLTMSALMPSPPGWPSAP
jgi:hypothetical protein